MVEKLCMSELHMCLLIIDNIGYLGFVVDHCKTLCMYITRDLQCFTTCPYKIIT